MFYNSLVGVIIVIVACAIAFFSNDWSIIYKICGVTTIITIVFMYGLSKMPSKRDSTEKRMLLFFTGTLLPNLITVLAVFIVNRTLYRG